MRQEEEADEEADEEGEYVRQEEEYVKQPGVEHLFLLLDPLMQCFTVLRRRKQRMGMRRVRRRTRRILRRRWWRMRRRRWWRTTPPRGGWLFVRFLRVGMDPHG